MRGNGENSYFFGNFWISIPFLWASRLRLVSSHPNLKKMVTFYYHRFGFFFLAFSKSAWSMRWKLLITLVYRSQEAKNVYEWRGAGKYIFVVCGSGSGIRCLFYPWIRDPGWVKNQDPNPGSGSGINNPDHISESLKNIFWVKILKSLMRIRDGKNSDPGSGMNIPDPQHCVFGSISPWLCLHSAPALPWTL